MEFLHEYNACIRYMMLPNRVKAFTVYDDENEFYNIYVNEKLDNYEKRKAVLHELEHIQKGHFKSTCEQDMNEIEWEMNASWHPETTQTTHCSGSLDLCG